MAISFSCEKCGHKFRARSAQAGLHSRCTHCDHVMTIPGPPAGAAPRKTSPWVTAVALAAVVLALAGATRASVHQNVPDDPRSDRKEMLPGPPSFLLDQPQVSLIHHGGALQGGPCRSIRR